MTRLFCIALVMAYAIAISRPATARTVRLSPHAAVTIKSLKAIQRNEQGPDEMYFKKNGHDIRPRSDDDSTWEFRAVGERQDVGLPLFEGRTGRVKLELWEQDPDIVDPDDFLGSITLEFEDGKYKGFVGDGNTDLVVVPITAGANRHFVATFTRGNEGEYEVAIEVLEAIEAVNVCVELFWQDGPIGQSTSDEPKVPDPLPADNKDELKIARHRQIDGGGPHPTVQPLSTLPGYDTHYVVEKGGKPIWVVYDGPETQSVSLGGGLLVPGRKMTIAVGMSEKDGHLEEKTKTDPKTNKTYTVWVHNSDDPIGDFHVEMKLEEVTGSPGEYNVLHTWVAAQTIHLRKQPADTFTDAALEGLVLGERAQILAFGSGVDYRLLGSVGESDDDCNSLEE